MEYGEDDSKMKKNAQVNLKLIQFYLINHLFRLWEPQIEILKVPNFTERCPLNSQEVYKAFFCNSDSNLTKSRPPAQLS